MPAFVLKKMIMNNFTTQEVDEDIADSIDFMVERVSETFVWLVDHTPKWLKHAEMITGSNYVHK